MTQEPDKKAQPAQSEMGEMFLDWRSAFQFQPVDLEDGELPDGAILIVRTHLDGDRTRLITRPAVGLDWITARGMLESALDDYKNHTIGTDDPDDDDEPDYSK